MKFVLDLTLREIRSSWRRLLFFFLCIALGVGSVVVLRSLIRNLTDAVGSDARASMTADVEVSSTSAFTPAEIEKIEKVALASGIIDGRDEAATTSSMAMRDADAGTDNSAATMVELKGVGQNFPLTGGFTLSGGQPFDPVLLDNDGAVVAELLLEDLGVNIGETIRIGEGKFVIRATFENEPGGIAGFRLGPRVFVARSAFDSAGILRNASRVRRRLLFRTTADPDALVADLRTALNGTNLTVRSYKESQENIGDQFRRTENYLALTGLLILVLGGIGVWNVARAFVEQKRMTVAILKCLGADGRRIFGIYFLQIFILGALGSLFGTALAQAALWLVRDRFGSELPDAMSYLLSPSAAVQGIILGITISLLFAALPLLQIRDVKPRLLLRDDSNATLYRLDRSRWAVGAIVLAALLALAVWQAGSLIVGTFFLAGLGVTAVILYLVASGLSIMLRRIRSFGPFSFRQAVNSLYRPGNQTRVIILAVGLGAFVVLAVQSLQTNLLREFDLSRNEKLPSLFIVDIQPSQIAGLTSLVESRAGERPLETPTIRARIAAVNGETFDLGQQEVRQQQGQIGREFAVTYRGELDANETVIAGKWWADGSDVPEVSVEESMAARLKIRVGDSITFDISGRPFTARVANVRKLDLRNTRTAFIFVFRPGPLDDAPRTYAATILSRLDATPRQRLQRTLLAQFPNIQIFDVADIISVAQKLIRNFVLAISFVGSFVMLNGIIILIGAIGLTRSQRVYENAILKTLGAGRGTLAGILAAEYAILGLLAGLVGAAFGTLLSWAMCRFLLDVEWQFDPLVPLAGVAATVLLVTSVGCAASFDVLFRKPLNTLRTQ